MKAMVVVLVHEKELVISVICLAQKKTLTVFILSFCWEELLSRNSIIAWLLHSNHCSSNNCLEVVGFKLLICLLSIMLLRHCYQIDKNTAYVLITDDISSRP